MKIRRIEIKNFRSIDHSGVEIHFPDIQKPISIVGYNNSGKTNIIKSLLSACGHRDNRFPFTKFDFHKKNTQEDAHITVDFDEPAIVPSIYGATKGKECHAARLEISCKDDEVTGYSYSLDADGEYIRAQEQIKGRALPYLFGKIKDQLGLFYIDFKNIEKHLKISQYSLLGKVIEGIKRDFKLEDNKVENQKGEKVSRNAYFNRLIDFIENSLLKTELLSDFMSSIEGTVKEQLNLDSESIKFSFELPDSDELFDSMSFRLSDHPEKPAMPLDHLGDGFRAMLIVAILRSLLNTKTGGKIIVLEEPETFLHEHFQDYFFKILCELAVNNQVIYTTHSKKFVDVFSPETIIKVISTGYEKSRIVQSISPRISEGMEDEDLVITNPKDFRKYILSIEPNVGNIVFADKVIIVEGPDDLLAYKLALSQTINLGLSNIAIICASGKDPIITLVQLCKTYEVEFFVIHDWDLLDGFDPEAKIDELSKEEIKFRATQKMHWTKNEKIRDEVELPIRLHANRNNLEDVLGIPKSKKSSCSVFSKINGKTVEQIRKEFPNFLPDKLLDFIGVEIPSQEGPSHAQGVRSAAASGH